MKSTPIRSWLELEANKEANEFSLHEALFWGKGREAIRKRLTVFTLRRLIFAGLALAEILLLGHAIPTSMLGGILTLRTATYLLIAAHWGMLEPLRSRMRAHWVNQEKSEFERVLNQSFGSMLGIAGIVIFSGLVWLGFKISENSGILNIFDAYAFLIIFQFSQELIVKTVYSGIYSLQRIYQPVGVIFSIEAVVLLAVYFFWNQVGVWGLVLAQGVTTTLSSILSLIFIHRAARSLKIKFRIRFRMKSLWAGGIEPLKSALAFVSIRFEEWWLIVSVGRPDLVYLFYVLRPFLAISHTWAFSFQNDLARMNGNGKQAFRVALERVLAPWTLILPIFIIAVIAIVFPRVLFELKVLALGALLLYMIAKSRLTLVQIKHFVSADSHWVMLSGIFFILGSVLIGHWVKNSAPFIFFSGIWMILLAFWMAKRTLPDPEQAEPIMSRIGWLNWVSEMKGPASIASLKILRLPHSQRNWKGFITHLEGVFPADSRLCRISKNRILVAWRSNSNENDVREQVWQAWQGLVADVKLSHGKTGKSALENAFRSNALGSSFGSGYPQLKEPRFSPELLNEIKSVLPTVKCYEFASPELRSFSLELDWRVRKALFMKVAHSLNGVGMGSTGGGLGWNLELVDARAEVPKVLIYPEGQSDSDLTARKLISELRVRSLFDAAKFR
jgi:hypothetical protein